MIRERKRKKTGGQWKERLRDRKFHPPLPVIVNTRVGEVSLSAFTDSLSEITQTNLYSNIY